MSAALSPVELDIIRNALVAAAEEMSVTVWRTSRSSVVRELLDYSTAVFDADGEGVAQAARMPVHLASMASCLSDILRDHAGRARPASLPTFCLPRYWRSPASWNAWRLPIRRRLPTRG